MTMLRRNKKRRRKCGSTKEKATRKNEWLFLGLKSVLTHIFGQVINFFWALLLPSICSQFLEQVHQLFV